MSVAWVCIVVMLALSPPPSLLPPAPSPSRAGEVISTTSSLNVKAGFSVQAGGLKWAYRKTEGSADKAGADKLDVLMVHGLGSSSYAWRCGRAARAGVETAMYCVKALASCPGGAAVALAPRCVGLSWWSCA